MKLFKISQTVNNDYGTFNSAVVVADSTEMAQRMHPGYDKTAGMVPGSHAEGAFMDWARPEFVSVEYLGETAVTLPGIVFASYNAG